MVLSTEIMRNYYNKYPSYLNSDPFLELTVNLTASITGDIPIHDDAARRADINILNKKIDEIILGSEYKNSSELLSDKEKCLFIQNKLWGEDFKRYNDLVQNADNHNYGCGLLNSIEGFHHFSRFSCNIFNLPNINNTYPETTRKISDLRNSTNFWQAIKSMMYDWRSGSDGKTSFSENTCRFFINSILEVLGLSIGDDRNITSVNFDETNYGYMYAGYRYCEHNSIDPNVLSKEDIFDTGFSVATLLATQPHDHPEKVAYFLRPAIYMAIFIKNLIDIEPSKKLVDIDNTIIPLEYKALANASGNKQLIEKYFDILSAEAKIGNKQNQFVTEFSQYKTRRDIAKEILEKNDVAADDNNIKEYINCSNSPLYSYIFSKLPWAITHWLRDSAPLDAKIYDVSRKYDYLDDIFKKQNREIAKKYKEIDRINLKKLFYDMALSSEQQPENEIQFLKKANINLIKAEETFQENILLQLLKSHLLMDVTISAYQAINNFIKKESDVWDGLPMYYNILSGTKKETDTIETRFYSLEYFYDSGKYRLSQVQNFAEEMTPEWAVSRNTLIPTKSLSDNLRDFYSGRKATGLYLKNKKTLKSQNENRLDQVIEFLSQNHEEKLEEYLNIIGYDKTTLEMVLPFFTSVIPFYDFIKSIKEDNYRAAIFNLSLDLLCFLPFLGPVAKQASVGTHSLALLNAIKNQTLRQVIFTAAEEIGKTYPIKTFARDMAIAGLRTVDPGVELIFSGLKAGLKHGTAQVRSVIDFFNKKLERFINNDYLKFDFNHYKQIPIEGLTNEKLNVVKLKQKGSKDYFVQIEPNTSVAFGNKYLLTNNNTLKDTGQLFDKRIELITVEDRNEIARRLSIIANDSGVIKCRVRRTPPIESIACNSFENIIHVFNVMPHIKDEILKHLTLGEIENLIRALHANKSKNTLDAIMAIKDSKYFNFLRAEHLVSMYYHGIGAGHYPSSIHYIPNDVKTLMDELWYHKNNKKLLFTHEKENNNLLHQIFYEPNFSLITHPGSIYRIFEIDQDRILDMLEDYKKHAIYSAGFKEALLQKNKFGNTPLDNFIHLMRNFNYCNPITRRRVDRICDLLCNQDVMKDHKWINHYLQKLSREHYFLCLDTTQFKPVFSTFPLLVKERLINSSLADTVDPKTGNTVIHSAIQRLYDELKKYQSYLLTNERVKDAYSSGRKPGFDTEEFNISLFDLYFFIKRYLTETNIYQLKNKDGHTIIEMAKKLNIYFGGFMKYMSDFQYHTSFKKRVEIPTEYITLIDNYIEKWIGDINTFKIWPTKIQALSLQSNNLEEKDLIKHVKNEEIIDFTEENRGFINNEKNDKLIILPSSGKLYLKGFKEKNNYIVNCIDSFNFFIKNSYDSHNVIFVGAFLKNMSGERQENDLVLNIGENQNLTLYGFYETNMQQKTNQFILHDKETVFDLNKVNILNKLQQNKKIQFSDKEIITEMNNCASLLFNECNKELPQKKLIIVKVSSPKEIDSITGFVE